MTWIDTNLILLEEAQAQRPSGGRCLWDPLILIRSSALRIRFSQRLPFLQIYNKHHNAFAVKPHDFKQAFSSLPALGDLDCPSVCVNSFHSPLEGPKGSNHHPHNHRAQCLFSPARVTATDFVLPPPRDRGDTGWRESLLISLLWEKHYFAF